MVERIPTGITGLDKLIEGGLPKGSITLVSGTPGTGKSILCSQVIFNNAKNGKKCLYLNLEQNEGRLEAQMMQFGWNPEKLKKHLKIVSVDTTDSRTVEYVLEEIKKLEYDLIVLDSLDSISSTPLSKDEIQTVGMQKVVESVIPTVFDAPTVGRLKLKKIFNAIAKSKATTLVTSEASKDSQWFSRDTISEFLSDAIIVLISTPLGKKLTRTIELNKMRQTNLQGGRYTLEITSKGITIS